MIALLSPLRRVIALGGFALALVLPFIAPVLTAPSADAVPPICNLDCPPQIVTYTSTITVTPPAEGSVHGSNASDSRTIDCSAAGGTCKITDHQSSDAGWWPTDGWPTWTLSYTGPDGYAVTWSGACSGSATCEVTDDTYGLSVTATSQDVQAPSISISAPARVTPLTTLTGTATDNSGTVAREEWYLCAADGTACDLKAQGPDAWTYHLTNQAPGDYVVRFLAEDASGNQTVAQKPVTLITGLTMTSSNLPAITEHPSFTFTSDDEDFTTSQCRAYPTGGPVTDWGSCTTKNSYAPTLADGNWTLQAQEVDDLADVAVMTKTTTVDTTSPTVRITAGPVEGGKVSTPTMHFGFAATDANLQSVTCRFDKASAKPCGSGQTLTGYGNGAHTFTVTATDKLAHVTTVVRHFSVVVPTKLTARRVSNTYGTPAKLAVSISPAQASGTVTFASNGRTLCKAKIANGAARCFAPATLASGTHAIAAAYHGNFAPSSTKFALTTKKMATALRASAAGTVKRGTKLTVRVGHLPKAARGTITVANGSTRLCSAGVRSGTASCSFTVRLSKGLKPLTVRYGGSTNYAASAQTIRVKVV